VDVVENIRYDTGSSERHGLYRDIYPYSSQKRKMDINNISVSDEKGYSQPFEIHNINDNVRILIGDPDKTFTGERDYIIKYQAKRAIGQLKELDEIYWNVTGNDWNIPIYKTEATVVLPSGVDMLQSACYFGPKGSPSNKCELIRSDNGSYTFETLSSLGAEEGFTVAVGFPKGVVPAYSFFDDFLQIARHWLVAIILPLLTLILSLWYWYKKGRDAKGTGTIVPQYDVPDDLTPMEVSGIANEKVSTDQISAEIIYLATKGYLKINQLEERFIRLVKSTDYELIRLKDPADLPNNFDRYLLNALFSAEPRLSLSNIRNIFSLRKMASDNAPKSQNNSVKLSDLKYVFYQDASAVVISVLDALMNKGYYKNLGRIKNGHNRIFIIIFMSVWASLFFGGIIGGFLGNPLPLMLAIFLSIIIYSLVSHFSPAKTEKGTMAKEYLLGLKDYLRIAEKDRLEFHNAPEKKPEIFEKLLPYAMVLGAADIWAKEFEGIYTASPSWYSGSSTSAFSALAFSHSLSNFSSFSASSLGSTSGGAGGGSGGGGSSGGGGGGGGGGGW
jgi:uncharacterized membrane protein YgcG